MNQELEYQEVLRGLKKFKTVEFNTVPVSKDKDTFKTLYNQLYQSVYHYARTFVDADDAEDITSGSFLKLWRSELDLSIVPRVRTWLNVCTRNACLDLLNERKRQTVKKADFAYYVNTQLETDHEHLIREELLNRINIEMENLPSQCKKVFKMAYLERQSSRQIAEKLGISENTVSCHRVKSLKLLRIAFQNYTWMLFVLSILLNDFSFLSVILP